MHKNQDRIQNIRSEFDPRRIKAGTAVGAGPARKYLSRRGRSYVATLTLAYALRALAAQDSLARCANYAA